LTERNMAGQQEVLLEEKLTRKNEPRWQKLVTPHQTKTLNHVPVKNTHVVSECIPHLKQKLMRRPTKRKKTPSATSLLDATKRVTLAHCLNHGIPVPKVSHKQSLRHRRTTHYSCEDIFKYLSPQHSSPTNRIQLQSLDCKRIYQVGHPLACVL
jgi:protease II